MSRYGYTHASVRTWQVLMDEATSPVAHEVNKSCLDALLPTGGTTCSYSTSPTLPAGHEVAESR
jgi:hypothetical protein